MSAPPVALIAAAADNAVIGLDNDLPWQLPADLAHFKHHTLGKPVLMGRRTFDSIKRRPLKGRHNIVMTRDRTYIQAGVHLADSLQAALDLAADLGADLGADLAPSDGRRELMVIGGAQIYALAEPLALRFYLTRVHLAPAGDTRLPPLNWARWREVSRREHPAEDERPAYTFLEYTRP